jgi:hypothetical protein
MSPAERDALRAAMALPYPAFPCLMSKAPACPNGFKAARTADAGLASLWARHAGELVGVPTGATSGVDVLDIDPKNGGREWYETRRSNLPPTRIHRTRSGGVHILFRHLDGLRNSAGRVAPGVDVRADGGYCIWWPSAGLPIKDHPLDQLPEWPVWLLPSLMTPPVTPPPPYPKASATRSIIPAIEGVVRTVAMSPEGQRNAITYWAAHRLRESVAEGKITEGLARNLLLEAAARAGLPPREASLTINSAMRGGARG